MQAPPPYTHSGVTIGKQGSKIREKEAPDLDYVNTLGSGISFWIKRDYQSQKSLNWGKLPWCGKCGRKFHHRRTAGLQDMYSVKIIINLNVLDHFCLFSLFTHLTLQFLHSIKSGLQGEFSKWPEEECSNVPIVYVYSTTSYHWSVTEELTAKKTSKLWAMFFLMCIQYNFWENVIMENDFLRGWQKGRVVVERERERVIWRHEQEINEVNSKHRKRGIIQIWKE